MQIPYHFIKIIKFYANIYYSIKILDYFIEILLKLSNRISLKYLDFLLNQPFNCTSISPIAYNGRLMIQASTL